MFKTIQTFHITRKERSQIEQRFRRTGELTRSKLAEYIPAMLMTNLSTLLLISVDGLVVGNLLGSNALSSVNLLYPATLFIGVISVLIANGVGACLSTGMGENNPQKLMHTKGAVKVLMTGAAIFVAVAQIPAVFAIIRSYHLSPQMEQLTWQYSLGIMVSMPFGLISTIGVCQLQIVGKMKILMTLAIVEGAANLLLDLFFVGVLKWGVAGAGFGTAGANILRCTATVFYLAKKTDIYRSGGVKTGWKDMKAILSCGMPDASHSLILALQNYLMMCIILSAFGEAGGVIKGVCTFAFSLTNILITGVQGSLRPLIGLLIGSKDREGTRLLMRQGAKLLTVSVCLMMIVIVCIPGWLYRLHGVETIPDGGLLSLRLYAIHFIFAAFDTLFRLYFSNRKDSKFSTTLTVFGHATMPAFAFLFTRFLPAPFLWLSYLLAELIIFSLNLRRYKRWLKKDSEEEEQNVQTLYLTVSPDEAVKASHMIRRFAEENGYPARIANRVSLCMEEMVAYVDAAQKDGEIHTQVIVRFEQDGARFILIDDGRCIMLDENRQTQKLITDNYELLKKIAKSVQYQYILNLNYTIFEF